MLSFWNKEPWVQSQLQRVHQTILEVVGQAHGFIRPILLEHLETTGKMLRPALVLITSKLGDRDVTDEAVRVAATIELIHLASLVHDDIIDSAPKRRGRATLFAHLGAKQAVLAGDFLLAKALSLTNDIEGLNIMAVSNAMSRLCESELEQDAAQGDFFITHSTYLRRIAGKTASLFALACYAGVALQKREDLTEVICHRTGYTLGMAFQIQDDILDYNGSSQKLGKNTANDLRCGIPTLPLIYALEEEAKLGRADLATLLAKGRLSKGRASKAVSLVTELGGIALAETAAQRYRDRAHTDIASLGDPWVTAQLSALLARLSVRSV
jgi:heptaprenyl diphosphate synthase